jgi:hypothetical protein
MPLGQNSYCVFRVSSIERSRPATEVFSYREAIAGFLLLWFAKNHFDRNNQISHEMLLSISWRLRLSAFSAVNSGQRGRL